MGTGADVDESDCDTWHHCKGDTWHRADVQGRTTRGSDDMDRDRALTGQIL
jgi:hypothetical protein